MAASPEQHGVRPPAGASAPGPGNREAPLLGRLLVEGGHLTEEQLEAGLAEQQRTGAPLGKALIDLGFVGTASVALALATQHGGLIKTEYGFAIPVRQHAPVGLAAEPPPLSPSSPDAAPVSSDAPVALPALPSDAPAPAPPLPGDLDEPLAAVVAAPADTEQPVEVASIPVQPAEVVGAGSDAAESEHEVELPPRTDEAEVAPAVSLAPATTQAEAEPAEVVPGGEHLAEVEPAPAPEPLPAPPAAAEGPAADEQGVPTGPPADQQEPETVLEPSTTQPAPAEVASASEQVAEVEPTPAPEPPPMPPAATVEPGLSLVQGVDVPIAADEIRSDSDPAAAPVADQDAEAATADGEDRRLRAHVALLERELEAARLAVETASAESRAAHAAAETEAARIVQVEHELAATRSENELLRAAFEQVQTGQLQEQLVRQRLTELEQRLAATSAQVAALQTRT